MRRKQIFTSCARRSTKYREQLGRYVMLTNYASGLCMPEIAAMAAIERLDMLLNDSMYGILFRDINMKRTFVDQHFSRMLNALFGHHHQHRRRQLSHDGRRRRTSAGGARVAVHQRRVRASRRHAAIARSVSAMPTKSIPTSKTDSSIKSRRRSSRAKFSRTRR